MVAKKGKWGILAPCLVDLIDETDKLFPNRNWLSDGSIGDYAHAARQSDHNPGSDRIVEALDITDDDASDCDMSRLFAHLIATRDKRVKYLIHNYTTWKSYAKNGIPAWTPIPYTGPNKHIKHGHISAAKDQLFTRGGWWPKPEIIVPTPTKPRKSDVIMIFAVTDLDRSFLVMPDGMVRLSEERFWKLAGQGMQVIPMLDADFTYYVRGKRTDSFVDAPVLGG